LKNGRLIGQINVMITPHLISKSVDVYTILPATSVCQIYPYAGDITNKSYRIKRMRFSISDDQMKR
jgi:hypothetical protein